MLKSSQYRASGLTLATAVEGGRLLRPVLTRGKVKGETLTDWSVWSVVEKSAKEIGIEAFGSHDLRRTCTKLCRKNGGDLEQIKFLLGHSSIQTTERYLGSDQEIKIAVLRDKRHYHARKGAEKEASSNLPISCDFAGDTRTQGVNHFGL
jgi:integrase